MSEPLVRNQELIVFTHTAEGQLLSLYWPDALLPLPLSTVVGQNLEAGAFGPLAASAYLAQTRRVLERQQPERCQAAFRCGEHLHWLDLTLSPWLEVDGTAATVVVRAQPVPGLATEAEANGTTAPALSLPEFLKQFTAEVRQTRDLDLLLKQTALRLQQRLAVERCLLWTCVHDLESESHAASAAAAWTTTDRLRVAAESRPAPEAAAAPPLELAILESPDLRDAWLGRGPVVAPTLLLGEEQSASVLCVATAHWGEANGLISLHPALASRLWSREEIDFVQEVAAQLGTAIAHTRLQNRVQTCDSQFQRLNAEFAQRYRELEEARKQAEEASRLKSEFLANTSHELRTPLNGMIGFLKLILEGLTDDPEEQQEFIQEAHDSALHLLNIINDVLDIAKIEAGKMQIDLAPVKLEELFSDVEDLTRHQVQQKGLYFKIQRPHTRDELVLHGNYTRLKQVLINLVGNAIKFTHEGGVTVSTEVLKDQNIVRIRVADTGIGVPLDKQEKLFQSFSQVDGSRTRQYGGTGLGLAISQKLIETMGGEVNFYSMGEGLGSTVTFTVPLYQKPLLI